MRRAHTNRALQKLVPQSLQQWIFALPHYPPLASHTKQRSMYDTMRWDRFWHNMANDVYNTISNCKSCVRNRSYAKQRRHIYLFPATGPLEFLAVDMLGPLPETRKGKQQVVIITDR